MNENLQTALAAIIDKALSAVDNSIEFLGEQLPDVVNQLLLWKFFENLFYFLIGISILVALIVVWFKFSGQGRKIVEGGGDYNNHHATLTHDGDGDFSPHIVISGTASIIVGVPAICLINLTWLQILIAPKIFLIEYAATLVK